MHRFIRKIARPQSFRKLTGSVVTCVGLSSVAYQYSNNHSICSEDINLNKHLINEAKNVVCEALDGYIQTHPMVARLDGFPDIKVLFRKDWRPEDGKVALISGGGSGHEPAHAGYLGKDFTHLFPSFH